MEWPRDVYPTLSSLAAEVFMIAIWLVIAAAIVGWQVIAVRSADVPSFGEVIRAGRGCWIVRWGLIAFWIWLGWHLFVLPRPGRIAQVEQLGRPLAEAGEGGVRRDQAGSGRCPPRSPR